MRYGILLLVIAIAGLTLVSAAAYNSAVITSSTTFTVKSTDTAKLALIPKPVSESGNKDGAATVSAGGILTLNFGNLQPNSYYSWTNLFKVKNQSPETLNITISCTGTTNLWFSTNGGSTWTQNSISATGIGSNSSIDVSVKVQIPQTDPLGAVNPTVIVSATAQ